MITPKLTLWFILCSMLLKPGFAQAEIPGLDQLSVKGLCTGAALCVISGVSTYYALDALGTLFHEAAHFGAYKAFYGTGGMMHIGAKLNEKSTKDILYKNSWITLYKWPFLGAGCFTPNSVAKRTAGKEIGVNLAGGLAGASFAWAIARGVCHADCAKQIPVSAKTGIYFACMLEMAYQLSNWLPESPRTKENFSDGNLIQESLKEYPRLQTRYNLAATGAVYGLSAIGIYTTLPHIIKNG